MPDIPLRSLGLGPGDGHICIVVSAGPISHELGSTRRKTKVTGDCDCCHRYLVTMWDHRPSNQPNNRTKAGFLVGSGPGELYASNSRRRRIEPIVWPTGLLCANWVIG